MKPTIRAPRFEDLEAAPTDALKGLLHVGRKAQAGQLTGATMEASRVWGELVVAKPYALDRVYVELVLRGEA
jgi:hypothetical protein